MDTGMMQSPQQLRGIGQTNGSAVKSGALDFIQDQLMAMEKLHSLIRSKF